MAIQEVTKEIIPFTFDEIEQQVKEMLLAKGVTDIVYPGSNISQISDIMSYLVYTLNTNTAINLQEVILPLATKRLNVLFGARQLGYEAVQKTSYIYEIEIGFQIDETKGNSEVYNITIPKYTIFESNGNKYYYLGDKIEITGITNDNRFEKMITISIKEGDLKRYEDNELLSFRAVPEVVDNVTITKQNYLLPFKDIEEDGIELWLSFIDDSGTFVREYWTKFDQFLVDSSYDIAKEKFVRLQNLFLQMPSVFFEIGGYGNPIKLNTLIQANILISKGINGVAGEIITVQDPILAKQITVDIGTLKHTGTDVESMNSIKENAPIFHNSANRAVTALDYIAITQRHEAVKYSDVWGIEEEFAAEGQGDDGFSNLAASVFFSFLPERTKRSFLPTTIDSESNLPDISNALNQQYDLQNMPRHPIFPLIGEPEDPGRPVGWQPQPPNWVEEPKGYDANYESGEPTPVDNPGQRPLIPILQDRVNYFDDPLSGPGAQPQLPSNWVENPTIDGGPLGDPELAIIQTSDYIALHEEYSNTIFNYYIPRDQDQAWYQDDAETGGSYGGAIGSGTLYKNWLAEPSVIAYINWLSADYLYRGYLEDKAYYDSQKAQYQEYIDYLDTPNGKEYTEYYNDLDTQSEQQDSDAYQSYVDNLELYKENQAELENLTTNWYLSHDEIYITPNTPIYVNDGSVFSALEPFKIMTMYHTHRQPNYMNFDYNIKIINYDLSKPIAETNSEVFNIIDNYFINKVERLGFEYFASNLQRRVDEGLGDSAGVEINLQNNVTFAANMYDDYMATRSQNVIITKLAFPYENMYSNGIDFDGYKILPSIDTPNFTLGRTKYEINLPDSGYNTGDNVNPIAKGHSLRKNGQPNEYYEALEDLSGLGLIETVNFTDTTKWKKINSLPVDVTKGETIKINYPIDPDPSVPWETIYFKSSENDLDIILLNLFFEEGSGGSFGGLNYNTSWINVGLPQDLYVKKIDDSGNPYDGYYDVDPGFIVSYPQIELPIYLGSITDNGATDNQVGVYIIRNGRSQVIETHIYFTSNDTAPQLIEIDPDTAFSDYGFGYMDVEYLSEVNNLSDNIPFDDYTMPRLRQVKFETK